MNMSCAKIIDVTIGEHYFLFMGCPGPAWLSSRLQFNVYEDLRAGGSYGAAQLEVSCSIVQTLAMMRLFLGCHNTPPAQPNTDKQTTEIDTNNGNRNLP